LAKKSESGMMWRCIENLKSVNDTCNESSTESLQNGVHLPIKTEMADFLPSVPKLNPSVELFVVGLARKAMQIKANSLYHIKSICEVIKISLFDIDNIFADNSSFEVEEDSVFYVKTPPICRPSSPAETVTTEVTSIAKYSECSQNFFNNKHNQSYLDNLSHNNKIFHNNSSTSNNNRMDGPLAIDSHNTFINRRPNNNFSYPILQIPVLSLASDNMSIDEFRDMKYITHGSNCNVFIGLWGYHEKVVVKMMKEEVADDPIAILEFDLERAMLSRLNHPNIVSYIGSGRHPRRFIVLEWLSGDTLHSILYRNQKSKPGVLMPYSKEPTFNMTSLLSKAKELASAIDYLHHRVHPGATIIHRDLKPDNIAFAKDGSVKLIDFGLSACVRSRTTSEESYAMTGCTGSLRYMAPEVTLRRPYTEKVDVYSFGVLLWQMAKDKVPFQDIKKGDLEERVAIGGERPKLDRSWSIGFCQLLEACWHANPERRPSFSEILRILDDLLTENGSSSSSSFKNWSRRLGGVGSNIASSSSGIASSSSSSNLFKPKVMMEKKEATWF